MATTKISRTSRIGVFMLTAIVFRTSSSTNTQFIPFHPTPNSPIQEVSNNNFRLVLGGLPPQSYRLLYSDFFRLTLDPRYQGSVLLRTYCQQNHRYVKLAVTNGYSNVYCIKDRIFLNQVMFDYFPKQGLTDDKIPGWYAADVVLQFFGYVPVCAIHCYEGSRPVLPLGKYSKPMHNVYFSIGCVDMDRSTGVQGNSGPFCKDICSDDIYEVENGNVFCTLDTQVGSTCSLQCNNGYISVGPDSKSCQFSKQWSNAEGFKCLLSDIGYAVKNMMKNEGLSASEALLELTKMLEKYANAPNESLPSTRRETLTNTEEEVTEAELRKLARRLLAKLADSSPVTLKRFSACSVAPKERRDCGYKGIGPHECENTRGCCFDSSIYGTIWCFHKSSDVKPLTYTTKATNKQPHGHTFPAFRNPPTNSRHPSLPTSPQIFSQPPFQGNDQPTTPSTIPNPGHADGNEEKCGCVSLQVAKRCLSMQPQARVHCGKVTNAERWPWHVIVSYDGEFCGGTLIAKNFVLTAAHCLPYKPANHATIRKLYFGVSDRKIKDDESRREIQIRSMKRVIRHPSFHSVFPNHVVNDIALIELDSPVTYTQTVRPLCLPGKTRTAMNKNCYITGFGKTSSTEASPNVLLKSALIPMTSSEICDKTYRSFVFGENICAGTQKVGSEDACQGDSGGPLACQEKEGDGCSWYLAGITSFGIEPCGSGTPGVYVNVSHYENWIRNQMQLS